MIENRFVHCITKFEDTSYDSILDKETNLIYTAYADLDFVTDILDGTIIEDSKDE